MNKSKLVKLFSIIVCVVMICGVFCSCNDKKGELAEKYPYMHLSTPNCEVLHTALHHLPALFLLQRFLGA